MMDTAHSTDTGRRIMAMCMALALAALSAAACLSKKRPETEHAAVGRTLADNVVVADAPTPPRVRNNNPCNVKGRGWEGQTGSDGSGHAVFSTVEHGLRAAAIVLMTYQKKHNLKTLRGILSRFAEGGSPEYLRFLSVRLGIGPDEEFSVRSRMRDLLKHMSRFETGTRIPDRMLVPYGVLSKL